VNHQRHNAPVHTVTIDAADTQGPLETWRHALGHGGINPYPLPDPVVGGVRSLQPRYIRVFLQEFFAIYPEHDRYDWTLLDPYMEALAATGASVVAAITFKPRVLYPEIDHAIWRPNDVGEWQRLIAALVTRYSVERVIVTHWEIGNETDIGEDGGSPFLIPDPEDYAEFYRMTVEPILAVFPTAKVGGPAACWIDNEPLPGFLAHCQRTGIQLDFISWHLYSDSPARHALGVQRAKELIAGIPGTRPELFITEWAKGFPHVLDAEGRSTGHPLSVEDMAFESRVAAITAASALAMLEAGVDWAFYYHIWDQACDPEAFRPFFTAKGVSHMVRHWNEVPHRFGLFGVGAEVRPQFFAFKLLGQLGSERLGATSDNETLQVLAGRDDGVQSTLIVNYGEAGSDDSIVELDHQHVAPGRKLITMYRIDNDHRWDSDTLEMHPVERRETFTEGAFRCQVWVPRDSVALVRIEDLP